MDVDQGYLIQVNGKSHALEAQTSLKALLAQLNLTQRRVAVELNGKIVPKSMHADTMLMPDSVVEIITAVGGG